jgi:hypothetical protein
MELPCSSLLSSVEYLASRVFMGLLSAQKWLTITRSCGCFPLGLLKNGLINLMS